MSGSLAEPWDAVCCCSMESDVLPALLSQMDVGTSARAGRILCSGGSGPAVGDLLVEAGGK